VALRQPVPDLISQVAPDSAPPAAVGSAPPPAAAAMLASVAGAMQAAGASGIQARQAILWGLSWHGPCADAWDAALGRILAAARVVAHGCIGPAGSLDEADGSAGSGFRSSSACLRSVSLEHEDAGQWLFKELPDDPEGSV